MSVAVRGLTKRFGEETPAVQGVSFEAAAGAVTTLLGPSGSGKTTVLRIIAGLEEPEAGAVYIRGRECTSVPVQRRNVGFVFQGYALFEHLDVRQNIAFGLRARRVPRVEREARVDELLALVQLDGLGRRYPGELSGGQRQRVAFARALAPRPEVLLLDEPFGALDARVRLELREWLMALHARTHLTTLLVTHDQDEALELSHQVIVMNGGRVEQAGAPNEVHDAPASPFVASFIGAPHVLTGRVLDGRAALGPLSLPVGRGGASPSPPDGAEVRAYVRPHEVRLTREASAEAAVSLARVEAASRVGAVVRLILRLPSGEALAVTVRRVEFEALALSIGERIFVDLGSAKVFVEDFAI